MKPGGRATSVQSTEFISHRPRPQASCGGPFDRGFGDFMARTGAMQATVRDPDFPD